MIKSLHLFLIVTSIFQFSLPANGIISSPLTGEWSKSGECNKERYIYTSNKKYIWMQKRGNIWKTIYKGIYVHKPGQKAVIIGDGPNTGGYIVDIYELTQTTYKGEWNAKLSEDLSFENQNDAKFTFVKCSGNLINKN